MMCVVCDSVIEEITYEYVGYSLLTRTLVDYEVARIVNDRRPVVPEVT